MSVIVGLAHKLVLIYKIANQVRNDGERPQKLSLACHPERSKGSVSSIKTTNEIIYASLKSPKQPQPPKDNEHPL